MTDEKKTNITIILNIFRQNLIFLIRSLNKSDIIELFKFYCSIRDSFIYLKKNIDNHKNIIKSRCSQNDSKEIVEQSAGGRKKKQTNSGELIENETVLETIRKYLTVRDEEKKLFGEVFTPVELVCEMLDKLPKEVWNDPTLKWLDPANGIGNYPVVAYYKLMDGLKEVKGYEDKVKRSKHIIENILFMVELNPINCKVCRKIFKMIDPNVEPKISNSNFLTEEPKWKRNLGIEKFDVIMGNPPYQLKKPGDTKSQAIWPSFVESSIGYLNKNGYLVFVHPSGWRNIDGDYKKIFNLIQERDLQHLTMRTFDDGKKIFGGSGTNYDYYCLKNTLTKTNKTKINDIYRNEIELDLNSYDFIPSGKFKVFEKLIEGRDKVDILYSSNNYETRPDKSKYPTNKEENGIFKYPVINSITQKEGIKPIWTSEKNNMFVPKVIWSNGAGTYAIIDDEGDGTGKYGLTQFSYGIQDIPKNLEYIKNALNDPNFIDLMTYVAFLNTKYNYKIIGAFKKDFWKEFDYKTEHSLSQVKSKKANNNVSPKPQTKKTVSPEIGRLVPDDEHQIVTAPNKKINSPVMRHCPKDKGKLECREFERDYMSQCPKKIIFDSSLTDQERKEACRRHYEERKPSLKPKPSPEQSPEQYCSKIKSKKMCKAIKKCEFNNGKCTKKTGNSSAPVPGWEGPMDGYGYNKPKGTKQYAFKTIDKALTEADKMLPKDSKAIVNTGKGKGRSFKIRSDDSDNKIMKSKSPDDSLWIRKEFFKPGIKGKKFKQTKKNSP
jgi:hypothetical protein